VAMRCLDTSLKLKPGAYVLDRSTHRIGRVERVELDPPRFAILVADAEGICDVAATANFEFLPSDDFRAMAAFEKERLGRLAQRDPAELVRLALVSAGGRLAFDEFKSQVTSADLLSESWNAWWAKTRPLLERSPFIVLSEDKKPDLVLRKTPVSYEAGLATRFEAASPATKFSIVLDYLADADKGHAADEALLARFLERMGQLSDALFAADPVTSLAALAMVEVVAKRTQASRLVTRATPKGVLELISHPSEVVRKFEDERVVMACANLLRESCADKWPGFCSGLLLAASVRLWDQVAVELIQEGYADQLQSTMATMLDRPERNPEALIWMWKTVAAGRLADVFRDVEPLRLALAVFKVAARLDGPGGQALCPSPRRMMTQIRNVLADDDHRHLRRVLAVLTVEQAQRVKDAVTGNEGIGGDVRETILDLLHTAHPRLFAEKLKPWQEDAIYTTEAGLLKRQKEFEKLVNVDMVENSKAIGRARAMGDLRENWEYKAAIEQGKMLGERASDMQRELSKAKVIRPATISGAEVTVGATVQAKDLATGRVETFTFLGPWDAEIEKGIYSYQAPMSKAFMGRRRGETFTFGERRFEVVEIARAAQLAGGT